MWHRRKMALKLLKKLNDMNKCFGVSKKYRNVVPEFQALVEGLQVALASS